VDRRVGELWLQYRRALLGLYGPYEALRPPAEQSLAEIDLVLALSESVEMVCVAEAETGDPDDAATALLAAAAAEASVAWDIIAAAEEYKAFEVEIDERLAPGEEALPLSTWLAEADAAFGIAEIAGGGAPSAGGYRGFCGSRIEELIERARPPAAAFALGAVSFGALGIFEALGQVRLLRYLAEATTDLLHKGFRLLHRAFGKLIHGLGGSATMVQILEGSAAAGVMSWVGEMRQGLETATLASAVDAARAEFELDSIAAELNGIAPDRGQKLTEDLDRLCRRYRRQMKCAGGVRTVLGLASPALAGSGGGLPLVAGLNSAALAYVLYSLAARLDTVPAPFIDGVPSIGRAAIRIPPGSKSLRFDL
jgi:hypothetical protein